MTRTVVEQYAVTLLLCYALAAQIGRLKQLVDDATRADVTSNLKEGP